MIFKALIIGLYILLINTGCMSQCNNKREFMQSVHGLNLNFINQKCFDESRELVFSELSDRYFQLDTLILVEAFTDVTGRYSCGIYSSEYRLTQCYYVENDFRDNQIYRKLIKTDNCGLTPYIIASIKEKTLDKTLKLGSEQTFTPNALLLVTFAYLANGEHVVNSFKTNRFAPPKNDSDF